MSGNAHQRRVRRRRAKRTFDGVMAALAKHYLPAVSDLVRDRPLLLPPGSCVCPPPRPSDSCPPEWS